MVSYDDEEVEYFTKYIKLAARMAGFLKTKSGELLFPVSVKGEGKTFYWSLSDKSFIWIDRGLDFYWVSNVKKDEKGRYCLFTPYTFGMGAIIMVPEDEIEWTGMN